MPYQQCLSVIERLCYEFHPNVPSALAKPLRKLRGQLPHRAHIRGVFAKDSDDDLVTRPPDVHDDTQSEHNTATMAKLRRSNHNPPRV